MKTIRCAVFFAALGMGLVASGCGPTLACGNPLDGSIYGFNLVIPGGFSCAGTVPATSPILALVVYQDTSTDRAILVTVVAAQTQDGDPGLPAQDGVTFSDEIEYVSSQNLTFAYRKGTSTTNDSVSYIGAIDLPGGENAVGIYLVAETDTQAELDLFEDLLDGLTFTN